MNWMIDASAWIHYLEGSETGAQVCDVVMHNEAVTSVLTIAELSDYHARKGKRFMQTFEFVQSNSRIVDVPPIACLKAGQLKADRRKTRRAFGLADALIYLTAQEHKCTLLTTDKDFTGLKGVKILG